MQWQQERCSYHHNNFNHVCSSNISKHFQSSKKEVVLNDLFFACFCIKLSDKTRKLILNGNNLHPRIGKRLNDNDVEDLLHFLGNNTDVKSINLAYNKIHCEGFIDIVDYIIANDQILELNVQNNEIGDLGITELCKNGSKLKLKTLRLNGNKFKSNAAREIALMLLNNSHIEHLDVAEVDQTLSSLIYFITVLRLDQNKFNNTLKVLDLSRPIPHSMQTFDSLMLQNILIVNKCLTELHLQKCNFSCHDIESMCVEAKYNRTLQLLDLGCNNIGDHGIYFLCNWLRERPTLAGLILCHNIITSDGARMISFALPSSRVRLLDISYNNITDDGIANILHTIKKSRCMRNLRIFGNRIGHKTAEIIDRMFKSGVLVQANVDVKTYQTGKELNIAFYPADHYKQRYYDIPLYGIPQPLKIVHEKNIFDGKIPPKIIFKYVDPVPIKTQLKILPTERRLSLEKHDNICVENSLSSSSYSYSSSEKHENTFENIFYPKLFEESSDEWSRHCYCSLEDEEEKSLLSD